MREVMRIGRNRGCHTCEFCCDRLTKYHCACITQLGNNSGIDPWLMPGKNRRAHFGGQITCIDYILDRDWYAVQRPSRCFAISSFCLGDCHLWRYSGPSTHHVFTLRNACKTSFDKILRSNFFFTYQGRRYTGSQLIEGFRHESRPFISSHALGDESSSALKAVEQRSPAIRKMRDRRHLANIR